MEEKKGRDTLSRFFRNVVLILAAWWLINNMTVLGAVLSKVTNILLPFIIGGAIAFIINIISFLLLNLINTCGIFLRVNCSSNNLADVRFLLFMQANSPPASI